MYQQNIIMNLITEQASKYRHLERLAVVELTLHLNQMGKCETNQ